VDIHALARKINKQFNVKCVVDISDDQGLDDEITINETVYIQVGSNYTIVHVWKDTMEEVYNFPSRQLDINVIADINRALTTKYDDL